MAARIEITKTLSVSPIGPGVYIAPYRSGRGRPVLLAIDSSHRELARKEVGPRADAREIIALLRGLVDVTGRDA